MTINLFFFSPEIENVFFKLLPPNRKPIYGIIYGPPLQSGFLEIIKTNFSKLDTSNNKSYILGDFNIDLYPNNSYVCFKANRFFVTPKNTMNSVQCLALKN